MNIKLSDSFSYGKLFRFALPSVIMMLFTSIYTVVDGMFVSNIVGSNALSSINIFMPLFTIVGAIGFMLGTGGSAEVAKTMGQGNKEKAKEYFSMIILVITILGVIVTAVCAIYIRPISYFMGASELLIEDCVTYGRIMLIGGAAFMLQTTFQTFFVVAEKPYIGLALTVASGVANIILDFVFVYIFRWGIAGAAFATVIGYLIGGIIPLIYFLMPNKSTLRLVRTKIYPHVLLNSCTNGSSEMLSNISLAVITFLYNLQMMRFAGEDGVAAITVIMYVNFIFVAILIGFSIGTAPIIGFNYGAQNHVELKNMFRKSMTLVIAASIAMTVIAELTSVQMVEMFLRDNDSLVEMTIRGFRLYSISFMLCGINIYASSFFTALCNGKISATISALRTLILQSGMIFLLPVFLGLDGIWLAIVAAEFITILFTAYFFVSQRKKYHYA